MPAAGVVLIIVVLVIVAALVYFLVSTIVALRAITAGLSEAIDGVGGIIEKSAPVAEVVTTINQTLDAGVDLLEGLLVKKAGMSDAMGLLEGLYPGSAAQGLRNFPESTSVPAPRIAEVYTKGTLTLARLGREAPIAAASPLGPALRDPAYGSTAARALYPEGRPARAASLPRSPVIGTDSPVQYDATWQVGGPRRRLPGRATAPGATTSATPAAGGATTTAPPTQEAHDADAGPV